MSAIDIESFLTHLAVDRNVAASTQNQALSTILFLYLEVLNQPAAQHCISSFEMQVDSKIKWTH